MDGMRPPQLPEHPVEVIRPEHLAQLLKSCDGRDFTSRRDTAVILLLVDTGMRRAECGAADRSQDRPSARRHLRVREGHRLGHLSHLWVGRNGPMTPSGIYQVVPDRARTAGLPAMHLDRAAPLQPGLPRVVKGEQLARRGLADGQAGDADQHREQALDLAERSGQGPAERAVRPHSAPHLFEQAFDRL